MDSVRTNLGQVSKHVSHFVQLSIDVVIPVYNGAAFIDRCLRSVLAQTRPAQRILVVDDCSTDGTAEIIASRFANSPTVQLLRQVTNSGPSAARNLGMSKLESDVVAFVDADDEWLENHLEAVEASFRREPSATVVFSSVVDGEVLTKRPQRAGVLPTPLVTLIQDNIIPQSAVAVRRERVLAAGGYNGTMRYAEDFDLWLRLASAGHCFVWSGVDSCVRHAHPDQVSARYMERMFCAAWNVRASAAQTFPDFSSDEAIVAALLAAAANDLRGAWNARQRSTIQCVLEAVSWVPRVESISDDWRKRVGWRWPLWNAAAKAYDALPESVLSVIRRTRTNAVQSAAVRESSRDAA